MGNQDSLAFGDRSGWGEAWVCSAVEHGVLQPEARLVCRRLDVLLMGTSAAEEGAQKLRGGRRATRALSESCSS